jgi:hypothetical protein
LYINHDLSKTGLSLCRQEETTQLSLTKLVSSWAPEKVFLYGSEKHFSSFQFLKTLFDG